MTVFLKWWYFGFSSAHCLNLVTRGFTRWPFCLFSSAFIHLEILVSVTASPTEEETAQCPFFLNHVSVLLCGCFKARRRPQEVLPAQTDGLSFYICPSCWMIRAWWKVRAPQTAGLDRDVTGAWKWFLQPLKITLNRLKHTETVLYSAASHSTVWLSISLNTKVLP